MILVCGEALIDLFPAADAGARHLVEAVPGGSPFNTAIGLARLGARSSFFGGLSGDGFGKLLRDSLAAEGVDLGHAVASDRLTTLSVVHRQPDGSAAYAFHGEGKADRAVTEADLPAVLPDDCRAITFGSYTIAVAPVADAHLALAKRESGRRAISIDPNVRLTVTPDMAAWRARFEGFLGLAHIVKSSDEDIAAAYGPDASVDEVARGWLDAGASLAFVTRGPNGASAYSAVGRIDTPGRPVTVVDTVGAGDTFHAAALAELDRMRRLSPATLPALTGDELREVLAYAVAAASITCTRKGADLPRDPEVRAALAG